MQKYITKTVRQLVNCNSYETISNNSCTPCTHPAGESAVGWSCIVSSPSLLKAAPAAVKISPT